jgi:hypothetical protein
MLADDLVLSEKGGVTQVITTSTFPSREAMEQLVNMGLHDGMRAALAQRDAMLDAWIRPCVVPNGRCRRRRGWQRIRAVS